MAPQLSAEHVAALADVFGTYKQERMGRDMFEHFVTPGYFPELRTRTPVVVIGGRGTGKTTALWGLSYEGTYLRSGSKPGFLQDSEIVGLYLRCDRAVAQTFSGSSRPEEDWRKIFTHYINLAFASLIVDFGIWADGHGVPVELPGSDEVMADVVTSLGQDLATADVVDLVGLQRLLRRETTLLELAVNNNRPLSELSLSLLGRPFMPLVRNLFQASGGKAVGFLLDEYESFSATQQQVINTLVKNAETEYTIKIAVRELGFHSRGVVGGGEPLISPADYTVIDLNRRLSGSRFTRFATDVVNTRIDEFNRRVDLDGPRLLAAAELFPGLTVAEEAKLLGAETVAQDVKQSVLSQTEISEHTRSFIGNASDVELVVLKYWASSDRIDLARAAAEAATNSRRWDNRIVNYGYASLFTLKSRRAVKIRKYYCGWDTYTLMAAGNIRFLLLLVSNALRLAQEDDQLGAGLDVSPATQTEAAQEVGKEHLVEVRDIDQVGADLLRLGLGLGRLFETMARDPYGHTPEVNEFYLSPADIEELNDDERQALEDLLRAAVQHSVVLRVPSSKRRDALTTREDDYLLHPILSAAFVFTHRRKRKILLRPRDLLGLVGEPRETLRDILSRTGRDLAEDTAFLPGQLELFDAYFSDSDSSTTPA
ncbi:MAG: hypothetical protein GY788_02410 [bacterium]|nr:hypothetical protein [bacterium]